MKAITLPKWEKPHAPDERAIWERGSELLKRGHRWPVPFLRPWLRRRGRALMGSVEWLRVERLVLQDWRHDSMYSTLSVGFDAPSITCRGCGEPVPDNVFEGRPLAHVWTCPCGVAQICRLPEPSRLRIWWRELMWNLRGRFDSWPAQRALGLVARFVERWVW